MLDYEFLTRQDVGRQLTAMPNQVYLIRLIHSVRRKSAPGQRLWTAQELARDTVVRALRAHNSRGFNVFLWPYADHRNAGYIFLDLDHARPEVLQEMRIHGHEPCVVLETSPGHLQAWIRVSTTPLEPPLATTLGRLLAERYDGDRASTDWRHLGRLAGFSNFKPARCELTGFAPTVHIVHAEPVLASAAEKMLAAAQQWLSLAPATSSVSTPREFGATPQSGMTPEGAATVYQRWVRRWRILQRFPQPDWSIVDLWLARKLLAQHTPPAQVREILRLGSPDFPRDHGDPEDYLRRTLARAGKTFAPGSPSPLPVFSPHAATPVITPDPIDASNSAGGR